MMTDTLSPREEHRRAETKHAAWLSEITQWKEEHKRALAILEQAATFIREHDAELDEHAGAIRHHDAALKEHDKAVRENDNDKETPQMAAQHRQLQEVHDRVLGRHNQYRGRHPAMMQEVTRLGVGLRKVSHVPG